MFEACAAAGVTVPGVDVSGSVAGVAVSGIVVGVAVSGSVVGVAVNYAARVALKDTNFVEESVVAAQEATGLNYRAEDRWNEGHKGIG